MLPDDDDVPTEFLVETAAFPLDVVLYVDEDILTELAAKTADCVVDEGIFDTDETAAFALDEEIFGTDVTTALVDDKEISAVARELICLESTEVKADARESIEDKELPIIIASEDVDAIIAPVVDV